MLEPGLPEDVGGAGEEGEDYEAGCGDWVDAVGGLRARSVDGFEGESW